MTSQAAGEAGRKETEWIQLDPAVAERQRLRRVRHFNVVEVPVLRALGFSLLALVVLVHNRFVLRSFDLGEDLRFVLIVGLYSALSWLALLLLYGRTGRIDLGQAFLTLDLAVVLLAIHHSGGERSWLFFLLLVRVADQAHTSFRQARRYAHLSALGYLLLVAYLDRVEGRAVSWTVETAKTLILYCASLYVAFTARTAGVLRRRVEAAVRVARDLIGELRDKQRQLEEARGVAEEASRIKSEFIANMSHEIRTPLNGIIGMTRIALHADIAPELREHLFTIRESAQALLKVVDDVLDFSRIEAATLELEERPFSLKGCVGDALALLAPEAREKGLELAGDVAADLPDPVRGDRRRLRQVLINLAGNAIKFTEAGRVEVRVQPERGSDDAVTVHFQVRDTGIGIPADKRAAVFEAFTQADGSLQRRYGGAGLGLTIAAGLVAAMGGRLWAESEVGVGSTFHFTVRLARAEIAPEPPRTGAPEVRVEGAAARTLRVLLADDNPVNVRVATHLLEGWGHRVVVAAGGREALVVLERERFDLALLDVQMPEMTGLELTAALRDRERLEGGHLPVVALTAHALGRDRQRCLDAGMDGYVSKPVEAGALFQAIEEATRSSSGRITPTAGTPAFDRTATLSRFGGDPALFREVAQVFLEDWPRLRGDLQAAVERRDPAALQGAAHAIKGTVAVFSAAVAVEAAARLEKMGVTADLTGLEATARVLEAEVARLIADLSTVARATPS